MSKKDFTDALKYGRCNGNGKQIIRPLGHDGSCQYNSVGHAPRTCGYNYNKTCNCCELCRNNCIMMKIIRDSSKEHTKKMMKELAEVQPMDGSVLRPFLKKTDE